VKPSLPRALLCLTFILNLATANAAKPLVLQASLPDARAAVAELKAQGDLPAGGVVVEIIGGTYQLTETLALIAADSGTADAPITWRPAPGETVILSGGQAISGWTAVTTDAIRQRLPEISRDHVQVFDLAAAGITDYGEIEQRGSPGLELFYQGRRMPLARYPNEDWLLIEDVPQTGRVRLHEGLDRERRVDDIPVGRHYGRIVYPGNKPAGWAPSSDIYVQGYLVWDWFDSFQRIESIDTKKREITFATPHHRYGYAHNQRFRFINVLEELDAPGEWYLNRSAGRIYFFPPGPLADGEVVVSLLENPLVSLEDVEHFRLENFTFEHSRGNGLTITGGDSCRIAGSTFRELGGEALTITSGRSHSVISNDFHHLAVGGVRVIGGDRTTLTPAHHKVINNHIHHFSEWLSTGQYGISIQGVGQYVAHNLLHDAPFIAIGLKGNDHLLEYNEVFRVCTDTGDSGAFYMGRNYTWQGNVIRYNYWHDLHGPGKHGVTGVYLDDFTSGVQIYGNLFYRASRGVQVGGGRHNTVRHNLFIDCEPAVHLDARGLSWAANYFDGRYPVLFERFAAMNADQPPYTDRYPQLKTLLGDEPAVPKGNLVEGNIAWGSGRWLDVYDFYATDFHSTFTLRDNVVAQEGFIRRQGNPDEQDLYFLNIDGKDGYVLLRNDDPAIIEEFAANHLQAEAPVSFDPVARKLTYHDHELLREIGFRPVPLDRMGLITDPWRTSLPEVD
jgi:hypothetical protein